MPPIERDAPAEAHRAALRHQHSGSSDHGRALVPMWDSSDPERAPPPLPLNPQIHGVSPSRAGTSTTIQSAHAALTEKARETSLVPAALTKRTSEASPERSLVKNSAAHRRMQSLQPNPARDLGFVLEGGRDSLSSTPRSPEKSSPGPATPHKSSRDPFTADSRPEDRDDRALSLAFSPGQTFTPIIRPIARRTTQSILGENTPPQSATMLALQNMTTPTRETPRDAPREFTSRDTPTTKKASRDAPQSQPAPAPVPLSSAANGSTALVRASQSAALDTLSQQILSLTNIATSLQKEMSQLSRRSRDNATDLLSLKEATTTRDEDIRRSLRELLSNGGALQDAGSRASTRDPYGASLMLDNRPHSFSSPLTKAVRPFSLPRIPSPNSFSASLDGDRMSTPSLYGSDGPATIALLEKIVREMGTKEGQDSLADRLAEVAKLLSGMASAGKVEELLKLVKEGRGQAVVAAGAGGGNGNGGGSRPGNFGFDEDPSPRARELEFGHGVGPMSQRVDRLLQDVGGSRRSSAPASGDASAIVGEDVIKNIKAVKDSVAQGGGLTAEVKALVRELRGEVLGMGREIGRRLDETASASAKSKDEAVSRADVHRVVEGGLDEMKQHINGMLREHRRQSAATLASLGPVVDYKEVYNSMRAALKDSQAARGHKEEYSRDDVMRAVKEAWEKYKPEIEVQQIGLERDEVLECLREGLEQYAPRNDGPPAATRDEVFKAVVEGLKHFVPPRVETPASLTRDEVLETVRECLEEFEFPVAPSAMGTELTKQDVLDAVRHGLSTFEIPQPELPLIPAPVSNDEVLLRLREIMELMRREFGAVSEEAKQNAAANGRDTEQVLDATRDGFERLRADMESYMERATGAAGQERFLEGLVRSLDLFREEIADLVSRSSDGSREMLRSEIESLRDTVNSSLVPMSAVPGHNGGGGGRDGNGPGNKEVIEALHDGLGALRTEMASRPIAGTNEVLDALQEGLHDLRASIERLGNKPVDLTANDEILDALKSGLNGVRSELGDLRDVAASNDRAVVAPAESTAMVPVADVLKHDDIRNLEGLISQLRVKVDAMESAPPPAQPPPVAEQPSVPPLSKEDVASKEDLSGIVDMLQGLQEAVVGLAASSGSSKAEALATDPATREDVEAIETILRNTKARLDDALDGEQAVRKDHIEALEAAVLETKEGLGGLKAQLEGLARVEDIKNCESLIAQVAGEFDEMKERHDKQFDDPERVTKTDVDAVEALCMDVKTAVDQTAKTADLSVLPTREDLQKLEGLIVELKDRAAADAEAAAKAMEDRQAETVGVSEHIAEVRRFLDEFQGVVKEKLHEGAAGIDSVGKILESLGEAVGKNANLGTDLKDMFETVKAEFEESRAGVVGAKLEADEKFQLTTDTLAAKVDERVADVLARLDVMQLEAEERAKEREAREGDVEAALAGTRTAADELKALMDTLGATVTESLEKMEEASKTVFGRVEDLAGKAEEHHLDHKTEHQLTRDELSRAVESAVQGLQARADEAQPQILEGIKDLLLIVGQHYEHSKSSVDAIRDKIEEAKPPPPPELPQLPPPEKYDDSQVMQKLDLLSQKYDAAMVVEKLDRLAEHDQRAAVAAVAGKLDALAETCDEDSVGLHDKLDKMSDRVAGDAAAIGDKLDKLSDKVADDTATITDRLDKVAGKLDDPAPAAAVHEKLDILVSHSQGADAALAKLDALDKVHRQVVQTAAEVSQFLASQRQRIADEQEDHERTLQETGLALERARTQREHLDATVCELREEEDRLRRSVAALRAESEGLEKRRTRLAAEVSALETASQMRREELREVEDRAQALERRVLEGVMDHSRVLLMASASRTGRGSGLGANPRPGRKNGARDDVMSRKRVASSSAPRASPTTAAHAAPAPAKPKPRTVAISNIAMAASSPSGRPSNTGIAPPSSPAAAARRIVSLSQMNSNVPAGGFKRSQSVRHPGGRSGLRKSSWTGVGSSSSRAATPVPSLPPTPVAAGAGKAYGDLDREDKENSAPPPPGDNDDGVSTPRPSTPRVLNDRRLALRNPRPPPNGGSDDDNDDESLRRSSMGTTVISTEQASSVRGSTDAGSDAGGDDDEDDEYYSDRGGPTTDGGRDDDDDEDYDDLTSEAWTESQVGSSLAPTESVVGSELSGVTGGGEVVVYQG